MRKTRLWLVGLSLLLALSCVPGLAEEGPNLLTNGGFEQVDASGLPTGWYKTAYRSQEGYSRMISTEEKAHSGLRSALIENIDYNDARLSVTIPVEPESMYRVSGWVLVERMEDIGNGANFAVEGIYSNSDGVFETAGEWQYLEWYGETDSGQSEVTLGVRLGGYSSESKGKVYFDDVSVVKVDTLPQGEVASLWFQYASPSVPVAQEETAEKSTLLFCVLAAAFALLFVLLKPAFANPEIGPLSQKKEHRRVIWIAFGALLLAAMGTRLWLAATVHGYEVDMNCFTAWSTRMATVGPAGFYADDYFCDYPPGYLLLLWPIGGLIQVVGFSNTEAVRVLVKLIPILADMAVAAGLFVFAKRRLNGKAALCMSALFAFNPAALVNGAAWGQVDSLLALLILVAAALAMERNWRAAIPVFVLAALVKPQALLFAPIGGMWLIVSLVFAKGKERASQWKGIGWGVGISAALFAAVVLPFAGGRGIGWLFELYGKTLSSYAYATLNTANLYYVWNANWVALDGTAPWTMMVGPGAALLFWAVWQSKIYRGLGKIREDMGVMANRLRGGEPMGGRGRKTLLALLSAAFGVACVVLAAVGASYSAFGTACMAFVFVWVILTVWADREASHLPFWMALALIGIYVLGIKIHERYLFVALPLLLMSYALTRDRRMLWLFTGFSVTTFVNTAIVLDNSLLFGASMGHLNTDTQGVNIALCLLNLLLCGYAGWLSFTGLRPCAQTACEKADEPQHREEPYRRMLLSPQDARLRLSGKDWLIMGVTTVLYAALAFTNLGSTKAPQTAWVSTSPQEQVVFELDRRSDFSLLYYAGVSYNNFSVSVSDDGVNWSEAHPMEMKEGLCYRWLYGMQQTAAGTFADSRPQNVLWLTGKYLRVNADFVALNLWELVARDREGNTVPLTLVSHTGAMEGARQSPLNLIDEQDTVCDEPGWYSGTYFDEIYHARTAYEHLHGQSPYEWTHPPLGKLLMSAGIAIFGMTPFGWRFAGTFIGVLMLPALYLLAKQITKRRALATFSMLALSLDLMHFTQTRIATIDSFPVLFIMLSYLCMARYMMTDCFAVADGEKPRLMTRAYLRSLIPLALSGLFMGLSIASKWIGMYSAVGLALLFFVAVYRQYRVGNVAFAYSAGRVGTEISENGRLRIAVAQEYALKRVLVTCGFCLIFFIAVPALIYYLSYIPHLSPSGPVTLKRLIEEQERMFSYHSQPGLGADHPYASPWWQWPLILKPMWFALDNFEPAGYASTIMCMGNPLVFYVGAACMLTVLIAFACKYLTVRQNELRVRRGNGDLTLCILVIGFAAQYLPWVLVPRSMYIYHYFASVPFIILATAWVLERLTGERTRLLKWLMWGYLILAAVAFVLFFPYASGWLTSTQWLDAMKWFPRLQY